MIIAIGGCSTSGKSALAAEMAENLKDKKVVVLCQDDFTFPTPQIPKINGHTNWEIPDSIDFKKMRETIAKYGQTYDVVIAEGLMIYHDRLMNKLYDRKLFVEIDRDTFMKRKHFDFRWGKEPDWYIEHIWESFLKYGQPPQDEDLIFIDGTKKFDVPAILSRLGLNS